MFSSKCSRTIVQNTFGNGQTAKTTLFPFIIQRGFMTSVINMRHYKALGLSTRATQNDIKSAYYKLSMLYHPDKNKGSVNAAKKFHEITAAYEVLGNLRLRKLYDKGIIHTAGRQYAKSEPDFEEIVEEDPQTKFYKAREKRTQVPNVQGRTPIYNFDEWSRAHYGDTFIRRQHAKRRYEHQEAEKHSYKLTAQNEILILGIVTVIIIINLLLVKDYDQDNIKKTDKNKEK